MIDYTFVDNNFNTLFTIKQNVCTIIFLVSILIQMNELEQAITNAFSNAGETKSANKAYLEFIKANFIIPVEKDSPDDEPRVLFFNDNGNTFLPVFTNIEYLTQWAKDIADDIQLLKLSGVNLLKGIGDNIIVCLNLGTPHYKEFNAAEIARMRSMVLKFFGQSS